MTTCIKKSCSFGLLCVSFVYVYQFCVCHLFPFGFEDGMWDLIVLIPDHCLSIYILNNCKAYIDGSIIYSEDCDQQSKIIREFFERLSKAKLTINLAKT